MDSRRGRPRKGVTFMDRVQSQTIHEGDCLVFTGCKDDCGYGRINKDGKLVRIHRAVYEMAHGEIPPGMVVMHSCDNRACWNKAHLSIGTQAENIKDMDKKGRRRNLIGSEQLQAKLNEEKVARIAGELTRGASQASLAREYGVSEPVIYAIKTGRRWTHVTGYGLG
jgi:hypothetical protein